MFKSSPVIRQIPYPYRAALAISDDPDFQTFDFFEEWYKFLNTTDRTAFGCGLGLEVSGGLFFHTCNDYHFSYFEPDSLTKKNSFSPRIDEYLQAGRIDTNHAHGDFDHKGGFTRAHAQANLDVLNKLGTSLPIFTNHGDNHNSQNIGKNYEGHLGDNPSSPEYHVDLLSKMGCQFVWSQDLVDEKLPSTKGLFENQPMKEKSSIKGFRRLRGTGYHAPNLSSLSYQLSLLNFDDLYKTHQSIVLYQHMGVLVRHAKKCVAATIDNVLKNPHVLSGFYKLSEEAKKGDLWVAAAGRLLRYARMIEEIKITERSYNTYDIDASDDVCLEGLTLYANTQDPVHIYHKGNDIPLRYNGPDETGRYSVTVPITPKGNIW